MGDDLVWRNGQRIRRDREYERLAEGIRREVQLEDLRMKGDIALGASAITGLRSLDDHRCDAQGDSPVVQHMAADIEAEVALSVKERLRRRSGIYDV